MQRLVIGMWVLLIILLSACGFGGDRSLVPVAFDVLDSSGSGQHYVTPQAAIVNVGVHAIDILVSGEALNNGADSLRINAVKANQHRVRIILDWAANRDRHEPSGRKLLRLEKGDWWNASQPPSIELVNGQGQPLQTETSLEDVGRAALTEMPPLKGEPQLYIQFVIQNIETDPVGVWHVTVAGDEAGEEGQSRKIVGQLTLRDDDLHHVSGKITFYSPVGGNIVKVDQLN